MVALPRDPRVAPFLTLRGFLEDHNLGSQVMRGHRSGHTRGSESDDDDIGFDVPVVWH